MTLPISDRVLLAFQAAAMDAERADFYRWWNARHALLGVLPNERVKSVLEQAFQQGKQFGIEDNGENRVYLLAATQHLLPSPDPRTAILSLDAIFAPASDDERLAMLAALRKSNS